MIYILIAEDLPFESLPTSDAKRDLANVPLATLPWVLAFRVRNVN